MITGKTTIEELAGIVTAGLAKQEISAVLVGGAVVSIYSENEYQSHDLDFISPQAHSKIVVAMKILGFQRHGRIFTHSQTQFSVEFPTGPIAIGEDFLVKPAGEIQTAYGKVTLLSPSQCVMDRLAWFYHSNDRQCLDQAVMVALNQAVSLSKIKTWSAKEGASEKYQIFLTRLKAASTKDKT